MVLDGRGESQTPEVSRWDEFRSHMPIASKWAYLDHAAVSPLPYPTCLVIQDWLRQAAEEAGTVWSHWVTQVERTREAVATVLNADVDEVALVANTTSGIHLVAEGFPWQSGDNVVTLADEFPSNLYPWMQLAERGVETRRVAVSSPGSVLDEIQQACDARTRLVAISWVNFQTGWRLDLDSLVQMAHGQGILVFVDAIQGLGLFPVDVQKTPVDFLAADGHKWLLGPEGAGVFYMRREHLDRLRPVGIGWNSVVHRYDFSQIALHLRPAASRYEGGSLNMAGFLALGTSVRLLQAFGLTHRVSPLAEQVLRINRQCQDELRRQGAIVLERPQTHASGILLFQLPGHDPQAIRHRCWKAGVVVNCRGGAVRISPHAYVNQGDLDRLFAAVGAA